ncbi:alpha-taxilin-like isoform X3 [Camellia sinensis]|uniref:alpha-taxilin-like isoform X3 n=1 Tax=Camellia sinensis TaxID=4442 RepID=UPI0010369AAD|nr:alpha-taxilin-like isoform X3 [Camellia sinensis]
MENPVADQLPDAHSLPDGFVDSSAEPLAQEKPLIDYKEEKLVELDSRPELVVVVNEGKTEKSEKSRRFPVPLSENDGSDASKELELPIEGWSERSDCTSAMPELRESDEKCQSSEKAIEGTLETQAAHMKETSSTENAENNVKIDECKRVSTEGQNLRLDLSSKFRDAIKEVSNKLEEQKGDSMSQLKENEIIIRKFFKFRLRSNLKQLADQYALSEEQYEQKLKQKTLELQLADLKMQQQGEKLLQEQSQMMLYAEQVSQLLATEKNLRLQLTADGEKFQQFQDALVNSNEVFETFKQEIDKMAKSIKELRKENTFLKSKCEKSDITLVELVEEREHLKKQLEKTRNQKEKLESLCRSLQEERKQNSIVGEQTTLIQ